MMSRREITPTSLPLRLTTHRRRTFFSASRRAAAVMDDVFSTVTAGDVMSSTARNPEALCHCVRRSRFSLGFRVLPPSYSSLASVSDSETTPTGRSSGSTIGIPLISCSVINVTRSLNPVLSCAVTTSFVITDSTVGSHISSSVFVCCLGTEVSCGAAASGEVVEDVAKVVAHADDAGQGEHGTGDDLGLPRAVDHTVHSGRTVPDADADRALRTLAPP